MRERYRIVRLGSRGGGFYCKDTLTGSRTSLETKDRKQAERLVRHKNEALQNPHINRKIGMAYLSVIVHYNSASSKADADATVAAAKQLGAGAVAVQGDLSKPANNAALFDAAKKEFGGVDIAINTTGMVIKKPIVNVTEDDFDKILAVNAKAAVFFLQEAGRKLNDGGNICTIVTSLLAA